MSDVAWLPMKLRIPFELVTLRARNASVVTVADTAGTGTYALTTLVLDDNALAPDQQVQLLGSILLLTDTLQVFSCQRCGLRVGVAQLIPGTSSSTVKALQEMRVAEVRPTQHARHGPINDPDACGCADSLECHRAD